MILGAGISGLSLGWYLKRRFGNKIRLTILEQTDRVGGWIQTEQIEGCLFETGPRSLRSKGSGLETLKLIEQLRLQSDVIAASSSAKHRYLWSGQKLRKLPSGPISLLMSPLTRTAPFAAMKELFVKKSTLSDESISSFMTRRFGRHYAESLLDPLTTGIYAGDTHKLSIRSCFPSLYEWERDFGSVCRGMLLKRRPARRARSPFQEQISRAPIFSFKDGMETLPNALGDALSSHLEYNSTVAKLHSSPNEIEVELTDGTKITADHLFSTIPAAKLAPLFKDQHRELSSLLMSITCASVAVVRLGYFRKVMKKKGFGYLIPSCEKERILGCVFDSAVFPDQNQIPEETRLTVMIGGTRNPSAVNDSKENLKILALNSLEKHLGIDAEPDAVSVRIARSAIPQYFVGHMEKIDRIGTILARIYPRMTLTGNSFLGVSVNDCIANSKRIVESLVLKP